MYPTAYGDVNAALAELLAQVQGVLGARFVGMYLSGSLALGDFDPDDSDIDLIVVRDGLLADADFAALQAMHARFDASGSAWAAKIEAVYIARDELRRSARHPSHHPSTHVPQIEKGRALFMDRLEDGWLVQCYTVREHGIALAGPDPQTLIDPIDPDAMRRAIAQIPAQWLHEAHTDPTWLAWLRIRENQAFVTLTLCRLLYTLEVGAVASKPGAARWAQEALGELWRGLIERALAGKHERSSLSGEIAGEIAEDEVQATVELVAYTVERFRQWQIVHST